MLESIIVLPRVRQRARVHVWNKVVKGEWQQLGEVCHKTLKCDLKKPERRLRYKHPLEWDLENMYMSSGIPRRGG